MKCPVKNCTWYNDEKSIFDSNCEISTPFQVSRCAIKVLCYDQHVLDNFDDDLFEIEKNEK
jgi:hypothetical protein